MIQLIAGLMSAVTMGLVVGKQPIYSHRMDTIRERQQPAIIANVGGVYLSKWDHG